MTTPRPLSPDLENRSVHSLGERAAARRRVRSALLVSAIFHMQILLAMAAAYRWTPETIGPGRLQATFDTAEETLLDVAATEENESAAPVRPGEFAAMQPVTNIVDEASLLAASEEIELAVAATIDSAAVPGSGERGSASSAKPGNRRVGFFGTEGQGERFVFVLDCSKSMTGDRFARARRELSRTLTQLDETQEFYVFFFSDHAIPMFEPRPALEPVPASKLMLGKARRWIVSRGAFGNTFPDEALRRALRMQPDAVFFLTDGEFAPSALDVCRTENRTGVAIHTIAFGSRRGEPLLQQMARENRGRYKFVQ